MKLHHFSPYLSEDEVVIDPTEASTRRQKYSKAEFKESGVHRTFFYVDPSQKEGVVWGNHYTAEIPDDKVYNLHADKDGHVRAAEGKGVSWLFNRLIEAGHHAARYTTGDRDIVAAFVPVKARRVDESKQLARPQNFLHDLAREYHSQHKDRFGLDLPVEGGEFKFDPDLSRKTALAFEKARHNPTHPFVKKSYDQFKKELYAQYEFLKSKGIKFEPWTQPGQPYANSKEMAKDVLENKRIKYFLGGDMPTDHPLHGEGNEVLRAVHDVMGHAMNGHQFGPKGEFQAWGEHARLFSPLARHALTAETHGQNSWVNFGPHSHLPVTERPYAEQKATVLPKSVNPVLQMGREENWSKMSGLPGEGRTARFQTAQGHHYTLMMHQVAPGHHAVTMRIDNPGIMDPFAITGTGGAKEVFGKVAQLVQKHLTEQTPKRLGFTATASEPSRVRLYDFLASKVHRIHPDYVGFVQRKSGRSLYDLVHKSHVEEYKRTAHEPQQLARDEEDHNFQVGPHKYTSSFVDDGAGGYGFEFRRHQNGGTWKDQYRLRRDTEPKHALQVFREVIHHARDFVHKHEPPYVYFEADQSEPERERFYRTLARRAKELHPDYVGHELPEPTSWGTRMFVLVHKKHMDDAKMKGLQQLSRWTSLPTPFGYRHFAHFETPGGKYTARIKQSSDGVHKLEFGWQNPDRPDELHYGMTGAGHGVEVMKKMVELVHGYLKEKNPKTLLFEADPNEHGRVKLYKWFTDRVHKIHPDYEGEHLEADPGVHEPHRFILKRKDVEPKQLARWQQVGDEGTSDSYEAPFSVGGNHYVATLDHYRHVGRSEIGFFKISTGGIQYKVTGTGHAKGVFDTMIDLVRQHVDDHSPKTLYFTADSREPSRVKLYRYFGSKVAQHLPEYQAFHHEGDQHEFRLVHKDNLDKFKTNWKYAHYEEPQQLARWQPSPDGPTHKRADFDVHGRKYRAYLQHNPDTGISNFKFELTNPPRSHSGMSVTGTGHGKAVFDHVIDLIDQHIREDDPHEIKYTADAEDHSRVKLYKYFGAGVKKRYPQYVTIHSYHPDDSEHKFHIVRKENVAATTARLEGLYPTVQQLSAVNESLSGFPGWSVVERKGAHDFRVFTLRKGRTPHVVVVGREGSSVSDIPGAFHTDTVQRYTPQGIATYDEEGARALEPGVFRAMIQHLANKFPRGLHSRAFQTSLPYRKSMQKMPTYQYDSDKGTHRVLPSTGPQQLSAVNDSLSDQGRERRKLLARLLVEAKLRPVALGNSYAMHLSGLQAGNYAEVLHNAEPDAVGYVGHYYGLLNGAGSPDLHLFHEGEGEHKLTVFDTPMKTDNLYEALGPVLSQSPMVRVIPKDGFNRVAVVNLPDSGILKNANASNVQQFTGQYATLRHRSSPGSSASARETHRDAIRAYEQQSQSA